ncbi:MAG: hypothetical protein ACN4GZ_01805 [Acidimicrobiales bacterium]
MGRKDHVYWDWFIAMKFVAAALMLFVLGWMWQTRHEVTSAYSGEQRVEALQISPLTLSAATIPPEEGSSFALATAPDLEAVPLERLAFVEPAVENPTIRGGSSSLSGTVTGLGSDDVGGEVRLTRITDGGSSEISVPIQRNGSWDSGSINGGRYRVRALVPSLRASNGSSVVFLADGKSRSLSLSVTTPPQDLVLDIVGPEAPEIGSNVVIAVTAGRQEVDANGRSVLSPVPGIGVQAGFSPVVSLLSASSTTTDNGGAARFLIRCELAGTAAVTLAVQDQRAVQTLPSCIPPESAQSGAGEGGGDDG